MLTTAKLTLHAGNFQGGNVYPESFSPRRNTSRWAPKNRVVIRTVDDSGNTVIHPRGRLRILKMPQVPTQENPFLVLELGCLLSLQNKVKPAGDDSEIELGEELARHEVINNLAALAKLGDLQEQINEWPLSVPLTRLSGSYVQQMGEIAYAAGYVLWVDNTETLRAAKYPGRKVSRDAKVVVGRHEFLYQPIDPQQYPAERIIATGTLQQARRNQDPGDVVERQSTDEYSTALSARTSWSGTGTRTPSSYRRVREPKGIIFPTEFPNSQSLITSREEYTIDEYQLSGNKFLASQEQRVFGPQGMFMPSLFPGSTSKILGRREVVYPQYEGIEVRGSRRYVYEPNGVVYPSNTAIVNKNSLTLSETEFTTYIRNGDGWIKQVSGRKLGDTASTSGGVTSDNSGGNQPPAPTTMPESHTIDEQQITHEVIFAENAVFDEDDLNITVQTLSHEDQLELAAENAGRIANGRQLGIEFGVEPNDTWTLNWHPFMVVDIVTDELDGNLVRITDRYVVEGEVWNLRKNESAVVGDGIYWSTVRRRKLDGSAVSTNPEDDPAADEVDDDIPKNEVIESFGAPPPNTTTADSLLTPDIPSVIGTESNTNFLNLRHFVLFCNFEVLPFDATQSTLDDQVLESTLQLFITDFTDEQFFSVNDIVTSNGSVVTSNGNVVAINDPESIADEIVVDESGQVVTTGPGGEVVSSSETYPWGNILIDGTGSVSVTNGNVDLRSDANIDTKRLTGTIISDDAEVTGSVERFTPRPVAIDGTIVSDDAEVTGSVDVTPPIAIDGTIVSDDSEITGSVEVFKGDNITIDGTIVSDDAEVSGQAQKARIVAVDGTIISDDAEITGSAQVTEPVVGGPYAVPSEADLRLWVNAQTGIVTDINGLERWNDNSTDERDVTRSIGNAQVVAADINGLDVIEAVGAVLEFATTTASANWDIFFVVSTAGDSFLLGNENANVQVRVQRVGQQVMSHFNNGVERISGALQVPTSQYALYEWYMDGSTLRMYQNNVLMLDSTRVNAAISFNRIGRTIGVTGMNAKVADALAYSKALPDAERNALFNTLNTRYSLTT